MKIVLGVLVFLFAWELFWWILGVRPILPWRLKAALKKRPEDLTLIDVRTPTEYAFFHIDGAENRAEILFQPELFEEKDKKKPLVVICMTGHRSPLAGYRLKGRGYRVVYTLTFGMLGWLLSGGMIRRKKV